MLTYFVFSEGGSLLSLTLLLFSKIPLFYYIFIFLEKLMTISFYFSLNIGARWIFDSFGISQRCWDGQENVDHRDTISKKSEF